MTADFIPADITNDTLTTVKAISDPMIDWPQLILEWKASNLSAQAFCQSRSLNYHRFLYHRSKATAVQNPDLQDTTKLRAVKIPPDLSFGHSMTNPFMLHYPNGIRLAIPEHADPNTLKLILTCLERQ